MLVAPNRSASTVPLVGKGRDSVGAGHRLETLWEERRPAGMSQDAFGARYGIGTQGMVSQYILGRRPLNIEAAVKFAEGLDCTVADISPDLAAWIKQQVLPVLGGVGVDKRLAQPTDRSQERTTPDERELLQTYRKLRELGRGELLLRIGKEVLEDVLRGRTGADVVPLLRDPPRRKR